jgi:serine/threonine protein kinase
MKPERLHEVERLYHAALEREPAERAEFLAEACAGDEELHREVASLLVYDDQPATLLNAPALQWAAQELPPSEAEAQPTQIGVYQLLAPLGKGGMGEVYLALDTRLKRKVAVKLLPAQFTHDRERVRRFEQEAYAASALNHPNIITVHDIGEHEQRHYLVTEYVEGQTLRQRLATAEREPLTTTIGIFVQIAEALATAHEAGIIHRDIKPENVMVRKDGIVKVLDFGLAKLLRDEGGGMRDESEKETLTHPSSLISHPSTMPGIVMGTPRYMSPEQARGEKVDARTDIFSLGVMLYEMVARRVPFEGATMSDVIAAILREEPPPLAEYAPGAPDELERIVAQALRKNREERYQDIKELLRDLKALKQELELAAKLRELHPTERMAKENHTDFATAEVVSAQTAKNATQITAPNQRRKRGAIALTGVIVAALACTGYWLFRKQPVMNSNTPPPAPKSKPFTSYPGLEQSPHFSPDGNQLAFAWGGEKNENFDIYVKLIDAETPLRLTTSPAREDSPVWFPDGRSLAFIRQSEDHESIIKIPALGGPEQELLSSRTEGITKLSRLSLSADGKTLAFSGRRKNEPDSIHLLALETLETRQLVRPAAGIWGDFWPAISPDGKTLAFMRTGTGFQIFLVPTTGGEPRQILSDREWIKGLCWTADGNEIIYGLQRPAGAALFRLPISGGAPVQLAGGEGGLWPAAAVRGNRLAWVKRSANLDIWRFEALGPQPRARKLMTSTRDDFDPQISADGRKLVFGSARSGTNEIWVADSNGANPVQLTALGGPHSGVPRWSPDGRQIVFNSNAEGQHDIYVVNASGGRPRRLTTETAADIRPSWSRDGQWIYFGSNRSGAWQVWKVPAQGGAASQVTQQGGREAFASPDGQFIYYAKGPDLTSLWRVPTAGGEEVKVLDAVMQGYWAVAEQGIWFLNPNVRPKIAIEFFHFATARVTRMVTTDKSVVFGTPGFAVAPDGKWLLLTLDDQNESDILVLDDFR